MRLIQILVPVLILAGTAVLLWIIFGEALTPRKEVQTASVVLLETASGSEGSQATAGIGKTLAQASGWIEPDAFPVRVAAQTSGKTRAKMPRPRRCRSGPASAPAAGRTNQ